MIQPSGADFKEDMAQYVSMATDLIHTPGPREATIKMLQGSDPVQKVATAVVQTMQRVDSACRDQNTEIQDSVRAVAAHQITNMIVKLGQSAGVLRINKDLAELALSTAVQDYINAEVKAGRMNRQKVQVAMQRDIRSMPPKMRKEMQQTVQRIQQTGRKYSAGGK